MSINGGRFHNQKTATRMAIEALHWGQTYCFGEEELKCVLNAVSAMHRNRTIPARYTTRKVAHGPDLWEVGPTMTKHEWMLLQHQIHVQEQMERHNR